MDKPADIAAKSETGEIKEILTNTGYQLLNNVLREKIEQNKKETNVWTDYKKRHKKVIEGLQEFPLSVSENCMVPIGKLAFMKGKLIHTNEILACLGDDYFVKYSSSQAIALCNRRILIADDTLKRLEAERNLYEMRQILPVEQLFGEQDKKDIFEHWDEDKLDKWRIQHRKLEKEYHQKLAELRKKEKADTSTEDDLFKRLDELELEELEDERCRLEVERQKFYSDDLEEGEVYDESEEDVDTSDSDEISIKMLQDELKRLKDIRRNVTNDTSNVSNSCDAAQDKTFDTNSTKNKQSNHTGSSIQEESKDSCSTESENISKNTNVERKKRVSFAEPCDQNNIDEQISIDDESLIFEMPRSVEQDNTYKDKNDDDIRIEFSPSSYVPNIPESNTTEISSPADIYKMVTSIKPILKRSPNDMLPSQVVPASYEDSSSDSENECYSTKTSAYLSVMKDIQEKKTATSLNNTVEKKDSKKTVSRFKMERVGNIK